MAPQLFGWQHIVYLVVVIILMVTSLMLGKKFIKTEKGKMIFVKSAAAILLAMIVWSRISIVLERKGGNWAYLLPDTFCAFSSLAFSLAVLIGKPHSLSYHCLWYLALGGGGMTLAYPDFISQNASFWYIPTITGLLHHTFLLYLAIALLVFGWFKPELNKSYIFALGTMIYILVGYFEIYVLKFGNAMCLNSPLLKNTPISGYFILGVGTVGVALLNMAIIGIKKLIAISHSRKAEKH